MEATAFFADWRYVNDCTQGPELLETAPAKNVLGDKAYDTNEILAVIERNGANAMIPSKSNRRVIRPLDTERYKNRNRVERLFCWLKHFRRIATRYEKLDSTNTVTRRPHRAATTSVSGQP